MKTNIKILIVEHNLHDVELLQRTLQKSGLQYSIQNVKTECDYEKALSAYNPDIILADYSLPSFDGLSAYKIRKVLAPDTPFIIVSGTIGEENAVSLIKMGVTDYVLKDKMYQIAPKIERALNEATSRKQKKEAVLQLKQREKQLQKIMDLSLDVICAVDQKGKFVDINAACKLVLDYSPEELVGRKVLDMVHKEDKDITFEAIASLQYGRDIINLESRFIRKSGAPITLLWSARWDDDEKRGYAIAKDITDLRKSDEKIKNSEERFRALLQNSNEGLTLLGADGTVIERSSSALKILGLSVGDISGNFKKELVHPDDLPIVNEACRQVKRNPNDIFSVEYRFLMPDGRYKWLETTFHNLLQEPAVGAIVLNFRDITERKLAEIAIQKSEEKYRHLFHSSPIPMWVYDVETYRFLDVNMAAIRHYGYSKEEFLSMTLNDIRPVEDVDELRKAVRLATRKGTFSHTISRHIKKGGEIIYVEVQGNSIELQNNRARVVMATDISERMKYIQAIEEQNVKLREIAWMQSHVVRAPLARMMGLVSLLNNYNLERLKSAEILNSISRSAHELDGIIREIVRKTEQVDTTPNSEVLPEK